METNLSTDIRPGTYTIDPARSTCRLLATHAFGLKPVTATMAVRGGTVTVDVDADRCTASASLDAATFRSDDARRDRDITGKRFLDAAHHPVIAFRSTRREGRRILGALSVRGVSSDVALEVAGCVPTVDGHLITASCVVDRVVAGVPGGRGIIARPVRITLEVCLVPA